jgi:ADP-glucose pyrophosphorylase
MILGGWGQQVDTTVLGLSAEEAVMKPYIASMGIYVFKKDVLLKLLRYSTSMHLSYCRYCTYVFLI